MLWISLVFLLSGFWDKQWASLSGWQIAGKMSMACNGLDCITILTLFLGAFWTYLGMFDGLGQGSQKLRIILGKARGYRL